MHIYTVLQKFKNGPKITKNALGWWYTTFVSVFYFIHFKPYESNNKKYH